MREGKAGPQERGHGDAENKSLTFMIRFGKEAMIGPSSTTKREANEEPF